MRILFVDNHPEFTATVVERFLAAHHVVVVPTIAAATAKLQSSKFDVVLVDYDLDDGKGDELVRWLRASHGDLKLVAVSARDDGNELLVAAGADATCAKVNFSQIQPVLQRLVLRAPCSSSPKETTTSSEDGAGSRPVIRKPMVTS